MGWSDASKLEDLQNRFAQSKIVPLGVSVTSAEGDEWGRCLCGGRWGGVGVASDGWGEILGEGVVVGERKEICEKGV